MAALSPSPPWSCLWQEGAGQAELQHPRGRGAEGGAVRAWSRGAGAGSPAAAHRGEAEEKQGGSWVRGWE